MGSTLIDWTDRVWNPTTGCSRVSPGCEHCYAERMAKRLAGRAGYPADDPFRVTCHPDRLELPLRWRKPARVFVNSMSDLFHEDVPLEFLCEVFDAMRVASWHTFQVLTKRPERLLQFADRFKLLWPLPNVWLGVTAENQAMADARIPLLLQVPAAVRFVSVEPMLGPIRMRDVPGLNRIGNGPGLDWVICGGETGPGARPMHPDWARSHRDQCQAAGVPFFFKQWGEWMPVTDTERELELSRVGKRVAGHLLDGQEWHQFPEVASNG